MELKPTRIITYRDFARNIKKHLEELRVGEIVEVRGPQKGIVCNLILDLEAITSGRQHGEQQSIDSWF